MRTTINMEGIPAIIIKRAIDCGIAKTKNEAVRLGMLALNKEYNLLEDFSEEEQVAQKIESIKKRMTEKGQKPMSASKALSKYKHLIK